MDERIVVHYDDDGVYTQAYTASIEYVRELVEDEDEVPTPILGLEVYSVVDEPEGFFVINPNEITPGEEPAMAVLLYSHDLDPEEVWAAVSSDELERSIDEGEYERATEVNIPGVEVYLKDGQELLVLYPKQLLQAPKEA